MSRKDFAWAAVAALLLACEPAAGTTYRVGPGEKYKTVKHVAQALVPGDVVEITGDIAEAFMLEKHGNWEKPITIRGIVRVKDGNIVRPKVTLNGAGAIECKGDWNVIEGLDISGARLRSYAAGAVTQSCRDLVVRNCRFYDNNQAIGTGLESGNTLVEMCEFGSNGGGGARVYGGSSIYAMSTVAGVTLKVENCYFHDGTGVYFVRSRNARNLIRYNWFESPYHSAVKITNGLRRGQGREDILPMHSDIVGNVFQQGWGPGPRNDMLQLGGEGEETCGTEGDFNIAHNLFIMTKRNSVAIRVNGNVDNVRAFNNVLVGFGIGKYRVYERGPVWENQMREAFKRRRGGNGEPVIEGSNNWISGDAQDIPGELADTIAGGNPRFADFLGMDYHPRGDSTIAGAGRQALPMGRVASLEPEYEPQKGIAADLKPRPRRKTERPSAGPFETAK